MFPVTAMDARLSPKRIIQGVELATTSVAVDDAWLRASGEWSDIINGVKVTLRLTEAGGVRGWTNEHEVAVHRMFWFAWYSFHPATLLVDGSDR